MLFLLGRKVTCINRKKCIEKIEIHLNRTSGCFISSQRPMRQLKRQVFSYLCSKENALPHLKILNIRL